MGERFSVEERLLHEEEPEEEAKEELHQESKEEEHPEQSKQSESLNLMPFYLGQSPAYVGGPVSAKGQLAHVSAFECCLTSSQIKQLVAASSPSSYLTLGAENETVEILAIIRKCLNEMTQSSKLSFVQPDFLEKIIFHLVKGTTKVQLAALSLCEGLLPVATVDSVNTQTKRILPDSECLVSLLLEKIGQVLCCWTSGPTGESGEEAFALTDFRIKLLRSLASDETWSKSVIGSMKSALEEQDQVMEALGSVQAMELGGEDASMVDLKRLYLLSASLAVLGGTFEGLRAGSVALMKGDEGTLPEECTIVSFVEPPTSFSGKDKEKKEKLWNDCEFGDAVIVSIHSDPGNFQTVPHSHLAPKSLPLTQQLSTILLKEIGSFESSLVSLVELDTSDPAPSYKPKVITKVVTETYESSHPYADGQDKYQEVEIEGCESLTITFDGQSRTEKDCDYVQILHAGSTTEMYGEKYSGRDGTENWPGTGDRSPLVVPSGKCRVYFHSDGSNNDWGYKLTVTGTKETTVSPPEFPTLGSHVAKCFLRAQALRSISSLLASSDKFLSGLTHLAPVLMKTSLAPSAEAVGSVGSKPKKLTYESKHPYDNNTDHYETVTVKGAKKLIIEFDEQSKTEGCDWVKFYKDESRTETWHPNQDYFSGGKDGGSSTWPGFGGRPALEIEADHFHFYFHSDYSVNDWGWMFYVTPVLAGGGGPTLARTPAEATFAISALNTLLFERPASLLPPLDSDLDSFEPASPIEQSMELELSQDLGAEETKGEDEEGEVYWVQMEKKSAKEEFKYEKEESGTKALSMYALNDDKSKSVQDSGPMFEVTASDVQRGNANRLMNAFRDSANQAVKLLAQQCISTFLANWPQDIPFQISSLGSIPQLLGLMKAMYDQKDNEECQSTLQSLEKKIIEAIHQDTEEGRNLASTLVQFSLGELKRYADVEAPGSNLMARANKKIVFESEGHPYANNADYSFDLRFDGAKKIMITFDEKTETESGNDWLRFWKEEDPAKTDDEHAFTPPLSGSPSNWPGVGEKPPLILEGSYARGHFHSNESSVYWGFKFTAYGIVEEPTEDQKKAYETKKQEVQKDSALRDLSKWILQFISKEKIPVIRQTLFQPSSLSTLLAYFECCNDQGMLCEISYLIASMFKDTSDVENSPEVMTAMKKMGSSIKERFNSEMKAEKSIKLTQTLLHAGITVLNAVECQGPDLLMQEVQTAGLGDDIQLTFNRDRLGSSLETENSRQIVSVRGSGNGDLQTAFAEQGFDSGVHTWNVKLLNVSNEEVALGVIKLTPDFDPNKSITKCTESFFWMKRKVGGKSAAAPPSGEADALPPPPTAEQQQQRATDAEESAEAPPPPPSQAQTEQTEGSAALRLVAERAQQDALRLFAERAQQGLASLETTDMAFTALSRVVERAEQALASACYRVGDRVICKYPPYRGRGDDPWFAGVIRNISENSASIRYDDGDEADNVLPQEIRYAPSAPSNVGKGSHRFNDLEQTLNSYEMGERFSVEERLLHEPPTSETPVEPPAPSTPYQYGPKISSGDIITVELNLTKGTLGFYRNQVFLGLAVGPMGSGATLTGKIGGGSSYFPAVSLKNKGDSVQFIKGVNSGSTTELLLPQTKAPSPFDDPSKAKDPMVHFQSGVNYIESLSKRQLPRATVSKNFVEEIKKKSTVTLSNNYMPGSDSIGVDVQVPGAIALVLKIDKSANMGLKDSLTISAPTVPKPIVFNGIDGSTINYSHKSSDDPELVIGDKVVRGPTWDRSEEDGGIGAIGTVTEIYKVIPVPVCSNSHNMEVSSYAEGPYSGGWICNKCRGHKRGERWLCRSCHDDYCFSCEPKERQSKTHPKSGEPFLVDVQWKETGKTETGYRWGIEGNHDLQIIESHMFNKPTIVTGDSLHIYLEPFQGDNSALKLNQRLPFLKLSEEDKMIVPLIETFEDKGPFTIEAWIRPEAPSQEGEAAIFSRFAEMDGMGLRIFCLGRKADGTLRVRMMNGNREEVLNFEGGFVDVGKWSHVAMAFRSDDYGACAILVNGKEVAVGCFAGGPRCETLGSRINIGGTSNDSEYIGFAGHIYDVRLWSLGLSERDINSGRNSLPEPTADSLILNLALTDKSETNNPKSRVEGSDLSVELIGGAWEESIPHPTQIELIEKNCKLTVEPVFSTEAITDGELFKEEHELFYKTFNAGDHHHDLAVASYMNAVAKAKNYSLEQMCSIKWSEISPTQEDLVRNRKLNELVEMGSTLEGKEGWPSPIEARFQTIQELNMIARNLVSFTDFSILDKPWSLAAALVGLKGLILESFKQELWKTGLEETKQDSGGYELKISRSRAAKHARNGGVDHDGRFSVFGQVFRQIHPKPASQLRRTQVNKGEFVQLYTVTFMGERSHDAGGPYRESWSMYAQELMSTSVPMLIRTPNGRHSVGYNRDKWMPHPGSTSTTHMEMFTFLGKLMGMAIRTKAYLAINFAPACWKLLLGEKLNAEDLESIDHMLIQSINSLKNIEQQGIDADTFEDVIFEVFTTLSTDDQTIELKSNGVNIPVTFDTRHEYANAVLNYRLHEFDKQIAAIRNGLGMVVPLRSMALFSSQELETQVCGSPEFDLKLLRSATSYSSVSESDQHVKFFWEAMESFTNDERCMFLRFTWGRSRLPLTRDDFAQQFTLINFNSSPADQYYPVAHTCFFQLELPRYSTLDIMKEKLRYAIYNCQEIDGDETGVGMAAAAMGWEE